MFARTIRFAAVAAALAAATGIAACGEDSSDGGAAEGGSAATAELEKARVLVSWFPEAAQGGYWGAEAAELGADDGVEIDVLPGGPKVQGIPQLIAGKTEFVVVNGDEVLEAREQGAPVVMVFGGLGHSPHCWLYHNSIGPVTSPSDFAGRTVAYGTNETAHWKFIESKFDMPDVKTIENNGQLAQWANDENMIMSAFVTGEPFAAKKRGVDFGCLMGYSYGYDQYTNGLVTTEDMIADKPEVVRAVVTAVQQGWRDFVADPTAARERVLSENENESNESFTFAYDAMLENKLTEDDFEPMDPAKWTALAEILGIDASKTSEAFTNDFYGGGQ